MQKLALKKLRISIFFLLCNLTIVSQNTPIPIAIPFDYFNNPSILTSLEYLAWSNPEFLSDEQYAVGLLYPIVNSDPSEVKLTFLNAEFNRLKPFLNSYNKPSFSDTMEKLYRWCAKNKEQLDLNSMHEDDEYNELAKEILEMSSDFKAFLTNWLSRQKFSVLPDGQQLPKVKPVTIKYINPLLNVEEEYEITMDDIILKKYVSVYAAYGSGIWEYKIENDDNAVTKRYNHSKILISKDSSYSNQSQSCIDFYGENGKIYAKQQGDQITFYHPNGLKSFEATEYNINFIDPSKITKAYDNQGKISFQNGNGIIYWFTKYGFYGTNSYQLTIKDGRIIKRNYYTPNGKLVEEVIINNEAEFSNYYNFKTGKKTLSNTNGEEKLFEENLLSKTDYKISVSIDINHGILPYWSVYPIASASYTAPKILNIEDVIKAIINNIDTFIDFKKPNLNQKNFISCSIPFKKNDVILQEPCKIISDVAKIELGSFNGKKISSWHDINIVIKLE